MSTPANTFIEFQKSLLQINENNFDEIAWKIFHFQAVSNDIYSRYLKYLRIDPLSLQLLNQIPFLPIRFFKDYEIKSGIWSAQHIYKSSGTTQVVKSSHYLWDENFYLNHAANSFEKFFGPLENFRVLALLPFYDTGHSSLVAMARYFIARSRSNQSGFFLNDHDKLLKVISDIRQSDKKILLLGVSHALLDLAERGPFDFKDIMVMETGGMKGRKEELTREELHAKIKFGFGVDAVYSEYGMTELCSQAYASFGGLFQCTPTMRVIVKEISDPFSGSKSTGILNIIDLANFHSCSFIETQDLGRVTEKGFEVLGRADNSEVRGCNLLLA